MSIQRGSILWSLAWVLTAAGVTAIVLVQPSLGQETYEDNLKRQRQRFEREVEQSEERTRQQQSAAAAKSGIERTLQLVAMIEAEINGSPVIGAAIAFGRGEGTVSLVTANHVVRRGGATARKITVRFKDAPKRAMPARLTEHFDAAADIAVLIVTLPPESTTKPCEWNFSRLPINAERNRGDRVYAVGNPNGIGWGMPVAPELLAQVDGQKLVFQSTFVTNGDSGGALMSEDGSLLGMIQADQPPFASAMAIEDIKRQLGRWGYLVELFRPRYEHKRTYYNLLEYASGEGMPATAEAILEACPARVNIEGDRGQTPVHFAASAGQTEILKRLLATGGRPNGIDPNQAFTPLAIAAFGGQLDAMKLLIAAGASLELAGWHGERPLHWAVQGGGPKAVELLISSGAAVDGVDAYGSTPLYAAALNGHVDAAKYLVSHGATTAFRNKDDLSPLDAAIDRKQTAVVEVLIAAGADVNAPNRGTRSTPLHDAAQREEVDVVRMLLAAGAAVNALNAAGQTPLAVSGGSSEGARQVRALLEARGGRIKP